MSAAAFAQNIRRFREAVFAHDRENPTHTTHGIGLCGFDMERLDMEDGEILWGTIRLERIENVTSGNFRILCDGAHDTTGARDEVEAETVPAYRGRELVTHGPREEVN